MFYQDPPNHLSPQTSGENPKAPESFALNTCPVCENRFNSQGSSHLPFCSLRCRQIDLGRWLNESYGLPYEGEDRPASDQTWDDEE